MLDRLFALETFGIKLGLSNMTRLCAALGHPEQSFAAIHVAGTNGKGSVTAMTHAALVAAGLGTARYTSPHLTDLRERFVIGHDPVSSDALDAAATAVLDCADHLRETGVLGAPPTFFEAATLIAFELFRRAAVEAAVVEVGLGGRFDATNVLTPVASAITSISFDHQTHLGHTIEAIAFEKAGIIKPGLPIVTASLSPAASAVVASVAHEQGARLIHADADVDLHAEMADGCAVVEIDTPSGHYGPLTLALRGSHQIGNALVTVRLLEAARTAGLRIPDRAIEAGLATAVWPARLELIRLDRGRQVLLDAAHNVEGAAALAAYLQQWHPDRLPLVIGVMADKDVEGILAALLPAASTVVATAAPSPRALPADVLAARITARDPWRTVIVEEDPNAAIDWALSDNDTVCLAGSIFLAGAVREQLLQRAILH